LTDAFAYRELAARLWSDGQIAGYYQMPLYPLLIAIVARQSVSLAPTSRCPWFQSGSYTHWRISCFPTNTRAYSRWQRLPAIRR